MAAYYRGYQEERNIRSVLMPSVAENFNLSGPTYLINNLSWSNEHHRRSIAASLVQGVYIQEHDHQKKRQGPQALAPTWWNTFNFQLKEVLIDPKDNSIFGAVYEFQNIIDPALKIPKYVIAFRGTQIKQKTILRDFKLDWMITCNTLCRSRRFQVAMVTVENCVRVVGAPNIWWTGHSLGSAIALLAGKEMCKRGSFVDTYLFNPPHLSVPIESWIKSEEWKQRVRVAKSFVTAGMVFAVQESQHHESQEHDSFAMLYNWKPYLFVNRADHICSEYIGYFGKRKKMAEIGARSIERLATKNSTRCLLSGWLGGDSEPLHALPSAILTTNLDPSPNFKQAHGIEQWWNPDLRTQSMLYDYNDHL